MSEPGHLTMAAVRRMTGLSERQIRYYDEKGLVVPGRTQGGHRLYTHADVERLLAVKRLLAAGVPLEEVRGHLDAVAPPGPRTELGEPRSFDDRGLEDVKIYFGSLRRGRHDRS